MIRKTTGRVIVHTSRFVHRLLVAAIGFAAVVSVVLAAAAWRLSQGPIELGWLADRARAVLSDDPEPVHVTFGSLLLAWEGFNKGVDYPLDLAMTGIDITDASGRRLAFAPQAHLTFSVAALLLGRFVPRTVEVDHASIAVIRDTDGAIGFGGSASESGGETADFRALRDQLARPAATDRGMRPGILDQIRRVHFRDAEVTATDRKTGLALKTAGMNIDLTRPATGHVTGTLNAPLSLGDEKADLFAHLDFVPGGSTRLDVRMSPFRLAGLRHPSPALAVTVPVSLEATLDFDAGFGFSRGFATLHCGQGVIPAGQGRFPLLDGVVSLAATQDTLTIRTAHFNVARTVQDTPETIDIGGTVMRAAERITAELRIALDQIDIADVPRLWPLGVGGGSRPWIVENVTGGLARHGSAAMVIEADTALNGAVLTRATGDLDVSNATFTWIDDVPPVEQTEAHLHLLDPDTLDIAVSSARQRIRGGGPDLVVKDGRMRITGLSYKDQFADIAAEVEGPLSSIWTLLQEPRLRLLSTHPVALKTAGGEVSGMLAFQFPLENSLTMDDVAIHADAHVKRVRVLDIAYGHDLDDAAFDLVVTKDGLSLKGRGALAAIPLTLTGSMDFNSGPADQVVQKIVATGQPDAAQLGAAGLHVTDVIDGPVPLTAVLVERRNGTGSVTLESDLTLATLTVGTLAWSKPSGSAASASATLLLSRDRLSRIDRIMVRGDDLLLTGSAEFADGQVRSLMLDRMKLGRTDGRGAVHFAANRPIGIVLRGGQIDLGPKLTEKSGGGPAPDGPVTPAWTLDGRFDRALLANGEQAANLLVKAAGDGETIRTLDAIGASGTGAGFSVRIDPREGKRHLRVTSRDAGGFLRAMDATSVIQSGQLTIDADFTRPIGYRPLVGSADIRGGTVKNLPVLAKLLQAITLYGLVDALRGPGMGFTQILLPFQYDGGSLYLNDARAYNSSLGVTAKGSIALSSGRASLSGTIVPAYFFNAMLGRLPLVGKLFSPEEGGGVFAARFGVEGPIGDPSISVNPVSALTPGFLRGIFGVFDTPGTRSQPPGQR
nr:AsmA-like C-terminal region-containing protein [uncultured Rhodopila sp.]